MATPNPRKFQEKIALLNQRQAEGTAEYDHIMTEVQDITRKTPTQYGNQPNQMRQVQRQAVQMHHSMAGGQQPPLSGSVSDFTINLSRGGTGYAVYPQQYPVQGAVTELKTMMRLDGYPTGGCLTRENIRGLSVSPVRSHAGPPSQCSPQQQHGGRFPAYTALLSPPPIEVLSRSISDSSLNQQGKMMSSGSSPPFRKVSAPDGVLRPETNMVSFTDGVRLTHQLTRTKSGCDFYSQLDANGCVVSRSANMPIPTTINNLNGPGGTFSSGGMMASTGSLPDLTLVQYLQPMNPPLPDSDGVMVTNLRVGSPHMASSFPSATCNSPGGLNNGPYNGNSVSPGPRGTSPGPSPSMSRKVKAGKPYEVRSHHIGSKNHLCVPDACYRPNSQGISDNTTTIDITQVNSGFNLFGQPLSPGSSHPASPNLSFTEYRSPVSPQLSPRSSPGPCHSLHTGLGNYSTGNSPSDSRSAPPSPNGQQLSPASSPGISLTGQPFTYDVYVQTTQLNQQFEQINMIDRSPIHQVNYSCISDLPLSDCGSYYVSTPTSPNGPPPAYSSPVQYPPHSVGGGPPPTYHTSPSSSPHPSSPGHPGQMGHSPPSHHPLSPLLPPASPLQSPLSPPVSQGGPSSNHQPHTPQTPQTPTTFIPKVVLTMDGNESESVLNDELTFSEMFGTGNCLYEQGSFESDILDNISRLGDDELSMMMEDELAEAVVDGTFHLDHRSTTSTGP